MSERRTFLYSGNVNEAFKEAAKKSLIECLFAKSRNRCKYWPALVQIGKPAIFNARNIIMPMWLKDHNWQIAQGARTIRVIALSSSQASA